MEASIVDHLVYMVTSDDKNEDTHVFVSRDRRRAEERLQTMLMECKEVKANWLESSRQAAILDLRRLGILRMLVQV